MIYERLHTMICSSLGVRPEAVSPGTMLGEITTDHDDWFLILVEIEIEFGIYIDETEFDRVRNVAELVELIDAKLTAREAA